MDKETLSNYGWIVICVLVLSVMIALATPFGTYIEQGVWSATEGLFDTNNSAMGTVVTYSITDGAGKTINPTTATELTFRANMDISKFKGVKIDGATVDKANYTASDNTVISFTTDYIRTISLGTHTIEILADIGSAKADFKAADGWEVPDGCTYTSGSTVYNAGEFVRTAPQYRDIFTDTDYEYHFLEYYSSDTWQQSSNGWGVIVLDTTKPLYSSIFENINGQPVSNMSRTFRGCTALTTAPKIPNSVTIMEQTFNGCTSLETAPVIPSGVTNMRYTFAGCTSLTDLSNLIIPDTVTDMDSAFYGCTSLTNAPTIPNSATNISCVLKSCSALTTAPIIPNSATNISGMFEYCNSLKTYVGSTDADGDFSNYVIPNSVANMADTFRNCTSLTTAPVIPSSVTYMIRAFGGCTSLTGIISMPCTLENKNYAYTSCPAIIEYYHIEDCGH